MSLTPTIEALVEAGATPEMLLAVVRRNETDREKATQQRREKDAARKRKSRTGHEDIRDVTRTDADSTDVLSPETKNSPDPYKNSTPISPPKDIPLKGYIQKVPAEPFARFWAAYPRKIGKAEARKAFDRAWKKLPPLEEEPILVGGLERAKAAWHDPQFIPHAATWLNGERWNDEADPPSTVVKFPHRSREDENREGWEYAVARIAQDE